MERRDSRHRRRSVDLLALPNKRLHARTKIPKSNQDWSDAVPLTNRRKYRTSTTLGVLIVLPILIALYYYFCFVDNAWLAEFFSRSPAAQEHGKFYASL